jgi:hypothetical protein
MAIATCNITGKVETATGLPLEGASVRYQIDHYPGVVSDASVKVGISWAEGRTISGHLGTFSFVVPQGLRYRVLIDAIQYNKVVTIPAATTKNLFDL